LTARPQYRALHLNQQKAIKKGKINETVENKALPTMPPKPNPQGQRRAARAGVQPLAARIILPKFLRINMAKVPENGAKTLGGSLFLEGWEICRGDWENFGGGGLRRVGIFVAIVLE